MPSGTQQAKTQTSKWESFKNLFSSKKADNGSNPSTSPPAPPSPTDPALERAKVEKDVEKIQTSYIGDAVHLRKNGPETHNAGFFERAGDFAEDIHLGAAVNVVSTATDVLSLGSDTKSLVENDHSDERDETLFGKKWLEMSKRHGFSVIKIITGAVSQGKKMYDTYKRHGSFTRMFADTLPGTLKFFTDTYINVREFFKNDTYKKTQKSADYVDACSTVLEMLSTAVDFCKRIIKKVQISNIVKEEEEKKKADSTYNTSENEKNILESVKSSEEVSYKSMGFDITNLILGLGKATSQFVVAANQESGNKSKRTKAKIASTVFGMAQTATGLIQRWTSKSTFSGFSGAAAAPTKDSKAAGSIINMVQNLADNNYLGFKDKPSAPADVDISTKDTQTLKKYVENYDKTNKYLELSGIGAFALTLKKAESRKGQEKAVESLLGGL